MNKWLLLLLISTFPLALFAQFSDNFNDGNMHSNPRWDGEVSDFTIDHTGRLQLVAEPVNASKTIFTNSNTGDTSSWSIDIHLDFNTSSANFCKIYLAAADTLFSQTDALFAILGGTKDNIQIWHQIEGQSSLLLETNAAVFDKDSSASRIAIHLIGNTIKIDTGFHANRTIATGTVSNWNINTRYFALQPNYTSTRASKFWFDNIDVTGNRERISPAIKHQHYFNNRIELLITEPLDSSSVHPSKFIVNEHFYPNKVTTQADTITLYFNDSLPQQQYISLACKSITDKVGNFMRDTSIFVFCGTTEMAHQGDVVINEIMANPKPNSFLPEHEYLEIINTSSKAFALNSIDIYNNHTLQEIVSDTILLPHQIYLLCDLNYAAIFNEAGIRNVVGVRNFSALNNSSDSISITSNNEIIDIVTYNTSWYNTSKANGGFSLERIDPFQSCNNPFNFNYSQAPFQGTPATQNSLTIETTVPFDLVNLVATPQKSISIQTSQPIDLSLFLDSTLRLGGVLNAGISQLLHQPNTYEIHFNTWPTEGGSAELAIQNLRSCQSETLDSIITLSIPIRSKGHELRITEIMADPYPSQGLPAAEYIELYNRAAYSVFLSDFEIVSNQKTYSLPQKILAPLEYVIVIHVSDTSLFSDFPFIATDPFPALPNGSGTFSLQHFSGIITDSISYSLHHYRNVEKANGGYSLESIRQNENCLGKYNLTASNGPLGGSPGEQNSVHSDVSTTQAPLLEILGYNQGIVNILFDRNVVPATDFGLSSINFIPSLPYFINQFSFDTLSLSILPDDTLYSFQIELTDMEDCLGNSVDTTLLLQIGEEPQKGDLIITEIMADPSPNDQLPEQEYFELFNTRPYPINLGSLSINGVDFNTSHVLSPKAYVLVSQQPELFGIENTVALPALSSAFLTNGGKNLILQNSKTQEIITEVEYSSSWHTDELAKEGGVSLELTNTQLQCYNTSMYWKSSADISGGTPGKMNANNDTMNTAALHTLSYYNNNRLSFAFSSPLSLNNFTSSFDSNIDSMYLSKDQLLLHFELQYGLTPELEILSFATKECNTNQQVTFSDTLKLPIKPTSKTIVINEVLFDPLETQNEFIELYNPSSEFISLYNTRIAINNFGSILDTTGLIIKPNGYIILASDTTKFSGFTHKNPAVYFPFFELPTLSNQDLGLTIINSSNDTIDHVHISSDLHYPLLTNTKGIALERINSNSTSDFISAPENIGFASPGLRNSRHTLDRPLGNNFSISDNYISANGDGFQDFITLTYSSSNLESINISVYDRSGFLIKRIAHNFLHSGTSSFVWIGDNDNNQLTEAGLYIAVMEVVDKGRSNNIQRKAISVSR